MGVPKEGYGASNNPRKKMGPQARGKVCEHNLCTRSLGINVSCLCVDCLRWIVREAFGAPEQRSSDLSFGVSRPNDVKFQLSGTEQSLEIKLMY